MPWWDALWGTMRIRGRDRIGLAEADRLVAGEPTPPGHHGLSVLLAAAAADPFPEELADEAGAVAGFARARREAGPAAASDSQPTADRRPASVAASGRQPASGAGSGRSQAGPGPRRAPRPRVPLPRAAVFRVAVGLAVVATGGTAFAAATGSLPASIQEEAHQLLAPLGVPAPSTTAQSSTPRPHANASPSAGQPSGSPGPGSTGRTGGPDQVRARELCGDWAAAQQHPHGRPMAADSRRALAAAAGGAPHIAAYCARILAGQPDQGTPSASPTPPPAAPTANRTRPGGGGGNQKGKGGPSGHPAKTHGPHSNG